MRKITIDEALNRIAEVTSDNRKDIKQSRLQRRTEFTDLYGIPFYAESELIDGRHVAKFFISVSPDLVYFMRFQFKLYIQTLATGGSGDFKVYMNGINDEISDYLEEQQDGDWIDGEGLYPSSGVEDADDYYDLLDVASVMHSEGRVEDAKTLLKPGFKTLYVTANASFKLTMYLYMKYSASAF